jgi:hypothetical protein
VTFEVYEWRVIDEVHYDGFSADEISSIEAAFDREGVHIRVGELLRSPELFRAYTVINEQLRHGGTPHGSVTYFADVYPDHAVVEFTKGSGNADAPRQ